MKKLDLRKFGADEHADCDELAFAIAHCITKARRWKRQPHRQEERCFFSRSLGSAQATRQELS
jgi:hypothetical protein